MGRHIDTLPRVRLSPADWERVEAVAQTETRSVANMLGVLVAEAMAARELKRRLEVQAADALDKQLRTFERAQKGASK